MPSRGRVWRRHGSNSTTTIERKTSCSQPLRSPATVLQYRLDALYLDAISAIVRRDFKTLDAYTQIAQLTPDDSQVYVEGYAYENDGNPDKALENYLKAIQLNSGQYATAYLRAGIVYHRKAETAKAQEMFDRAEQLYRAGSNNEGVNEVMRQRGIVFRDETTRRRKRSFGSRLKLRAPSATKRNRSPR